MFFCCEELDFCLGAIARGWGVRYRGDLAVRHKLSPERRLSWQGKRWFHFVRNRIYVERKHGAGWAALAPRMAGYLVKGICNGLTGDTLRAIAAALRLSAGLTVRPKPERARAYIASNDRAHRRSALLRIKDEVLIRLPRAA